ncbi:hypothetical protein C5167_003593 [Papaver somniferum]|uniref:Uncharacterized protein n=1 Tax=Papaver somniferum TaxID=3469 RepID=A0A4Y7L402_PAPSO|nr:hypothetical protein C5167_003593 [Papaver somniferum]
MAAYKSCHQSLKFVLLVSSFVLYLSCTSVYALNVGVQTTGTGVSLMKQCSRKCESEFCSDDYLSEKCSQTFLNCMKNFKDIGGWTFKGNKCDVGEVVDIISLVIDAALLAGKVLHNLARSI